MIVRVSKTIAIPDTDPNLPNQLAKAIRQGYDVEIMSGDKKILRIVDNMLHKK